MHDNNAVWRQNIEGALHIGCTHWMIIGNAAAPIASMDPIRPVPQPWSTGFDDKIKCKYPRPKGSHNKIAESRSRITRIPWKSKRRIQDHRIRAKINKSISKISTIPQWNTNLGSSNPRISQMSKLWKSRIRAISQINVQCSRSTGSRKKSQEPLFTGADSKK